jgi:N-acetylglucosamine kinase-like BadF-type ATPase
MQPRKRSDRLRQGLRLIAGIDGGGTKTIALLADESQAILGRGYGGASNYHTVGFDSAISAIDSAVADALHNAGYPARQPLAAVTLGMAGVDRPEDRARFQDWISRRFPGAKVLQVSDAHLVLAAGAGSEPGLAIISGTGSIAYAQDGRGNTARAGGWGYLLGDEGAGYWIGLSALKAITRAWDGLGPETALTRRILDELSLSSPPDLVRFVYNPQTNRGEFAKLYMLVEVCASAGDAAAQEILTTAARSLAGFAVAAARRLHLTSPLPCAMAGGVLVHNESMRAAIAGHARLEACLFDPIVTVPDPAVGAVRLAAGLLN